MAALSRGASMCLLCAVDIRSNIRSVCIDDDQDAGSASNDEDLGPRVQWPEKPSDYDSEDDIGPGVYALVEFCNPLTGVITIQVV